jgi:bacteriocin biosynthesis cyclodehydratase domain-containing protein
MPRPRVAVGHALGMCPRIDPHLPLVWRSPRELQLGGLRPRAVVTDPDGVAAGLISALRHGARRSTLHAIGAGLGGDAREVDRLLEVLSPALLPEGGEAGTAPARRHVVAIDADSPIATAIAASLTALGYDTVAAGSADRGDVDLAVLVAAWVVAPAAHLGWLRADVPHLAVVLDDDGAEVGPLVEPGSGPCLRCRELARRDVDPAWPAIATQLAGRPLPLGRPRAELEAVARAASAVDDRLRLGRSPLAASSLAISADGTTTTRRHPSHPECGCRALGGTATAPVPLDAHRPAGPSSGRADAVPA